MFCFTVTFSLAHSMATYGQAPDARSTYLLASLQGAPSMKYRSITFWPNATRLNELGIKRQLHDQRSL